MKRKVEADPVEVPRELKRLRRYLGFSQHQMAEALAVDWQTINAWEARRRAPPLMALKLVRLMAEGHVPVDVPPEDPPPGETEEARKQRERREQWTSTFVLTRELAPSARCWYARPSDPCGGRRFHFAVLFPPYPEGSDTLETACCEAHAHEGLYHLRRETIKRKRDWLRSKRRMGWVEAWEETLETTL